MYHETLGTRVSCVHWATVRHVGSLKMWFFKDHETLGSRVSCIHWTIVQHFGGLKMRFLKRPETLGSRLHGYLWEHIRFLVASKCGTTCPSPRSESYVQRPKRSEAASCKTKAKLAIKAALKPTSTTKTKKCPKKKTQKNEVVDQVHLQRPFWGPKHITKLGLLS
jgi:hypothetical protein